MNEELLDHIANWLMYAMQASIVVPMAVVWKRRRHFSPTVGLLSWYVYLSLGCVLASKLYPVYLTTNYGSLIAFNLGKIALFGAVYHRVLQGWGRPAVAVAAGASVLSGLAVAAYDMNLAVTVSRVMQCAVLAGFALLYLDQALSRPAPNPPTHDPLWLLSVAQLIYSAGTVTAFSLDYLSVTRYDQTLKWLVIPLAGLAFNYILTLAFARARRNPAPRPVAEPTSTTRLAGL